MNGPRRFSLALAIAAVVLAVTPRSGDRVLLEIDRRQSGPVSPEAVARLTPLQELGSGWIAEASAATVAWLQAQGVSLRVLDPAPSGRAHFLLFFPAGLKPGTTPERAAGLKSGSPADAGALDAARALGPVVAVEDGIYLLASSTEDVRGALPASVSLARLPASADIRMSFDTAGAARAVPRGQAGAAAPADPRIAQAVGEVSPSRLATLVRQLESFQTRYASTSNCESAGTAIYEYFRALGVRAESDYFTFGSKPYSTSNIIGTIPGAADPDRVVILCAHYDSTSAQAATFAPGADDNGSGTAAVLEAARVLAAAGPFDFTIKLVAFSAEEWGLYGSKHYAAEAKQRGEQIVGVVNLDMIGYADSLPEDLDVTGNVASEWLATRFQSTTALYDPLPILKKVSASERSSDHAPFWDQGYSAVECIEDTPVRNPYYHTITDTSDTLNPDFHASVARAAVAVVADLAQPPGTVATPAGLGAVYETTRSLFVAATSVRLSWQASAGATGYHVYRAASSHGTYSRLTTSPVTTTGYFDALTVTRRARQEAPPIASASAYPFYVVTAVDAQGHESNRSAEAVPR